MSVVKTSIIVFITLLCLLSKQSLADGNSPLSSNKTSAFQMPRSALKADIDGELNDDIWASALTISLDLVNNPWNNQPSPVKTTAKIIENGDFLYIAFIAQDPNPENIIAALSDRDSRWGDDLVGIKLDTSNNRRLNYSFLVNPFGVQHDQIYNEMTGNANNAWDGIWQSYGKLTDKGYQVEMAIPFHILNFEASNTDKAWAFELIRLYPRDTNLRLSHVPLDRNNACWLCQYPELSGFKDIKSNKNITLTPSLVAGKNQHRDVYDANDDWHDENDVEAGLDLRWGINSETLLNLTLNPDFSTVESDQGQLTVNQTFALFNEEKRTFFLENADYFTSNFNLVYTRNIAAPDYGVKLTGNSDKHTYGFLVTNDSETNFILPGNNRSDIFLSKEESHSSALRYRYDFSDNLSLGLINTVRVSENYHNIITGVDAKYRLDDSHSILAQVVHSDTKDEISYQPMNESDTAVKVQLLHQSEYWEFSAEHQQLGENFRADLGFMNKTDYQKDSLDMKRTFYGDVDSFWSDANVNINAFISHDEAGMVLEQNLTSSAGIHGPMLSYLELKLYQTEKLGLQTTRFEEDQTEVYFFIQPFNNFYSETQVNIGDKIDYNNDRVGDFQEFWSHFVINITKHLELDLSYTYSELDFAGENVYLEQVTDLRLSYQFDVRSYLKLNVTLDDIKFNSLNNPSISFSNAGTSQHDQYLSTQLLYAYKINPQTVFYLGYSDNSMQDDYLKTFKQTERSFFSKISFAWMPN